MLLQKSIHHSVTIVIHHLLVALIPSSEKQLKYLVRACIVQSCSYQSRDRSRAKQRAKQRSKTWSVIIIMESLHCHGEER